MEPHQPGLVGAAEGAGGGLEAMSLPDDVLLQALGHLDPLDLVHAQSACRRLRDLASSQQLWEPLCRRKWGRRPGACAPSLAHGDWRALFAGSNGLKQPNFSTQHTVLDAASKGAEDVYAVAELACGDGGTQVALSTGSRLYTCHLKTSSNSSPTAPKLLWEWPNMEHHQQGSQVHGPSSITASALCWLETPHVAASGHALLAGSMQGSMHVIWPSDQAATTQGHQETLLTGPGPPVSDIVPLPGTSQVAVLHDSLLFQGTPQHAAQAGSLVRIFDLAAGGAPTSSTASASGPGPASSFGSAGTHSNMALRPLGTAHDVLEDWGLVALAARPGSSAELLAVSVAGPSCSSCAFRGIPWLCAHKQPSRAAALCVLDTRLPSLVADRFPLQHRSIYPRLATMREHYLCTSHLDSAVCCWDLRRMSAPLFVQERLDLMAEGPLGPPVRLPSYQALWLCTGSPGSSLLVGRAENGCVWAWDLAAALGWEDGSWPGVWHVMEQVPAWERREVEERAWPVCLGTVPPSASNIPYIRLLNVQDPPALLALSGGPKPQQGQRPVLARAATSGLGGDTDDYEEEEEEAQDGEEDEGQGRQEVGGGTRGQGGAEVEYEPEYDCLVYAAFAPPPPGLPGVGQKEEEQDHGDDSLF